jgi:1-aminocyclopropane-1-carboxylate deaminase
MQPVSFESITLDEIDLPIFNKKKVSVDVLRLDKMHPVISGNKWFKLKHYLQAARDEGKEQLMTFGGAYSNHIVATAATGRLLGLKTAGIIRGEKPKFLSKTLQKSANYGMELFFVSRQDYSSKALPLEISAMKQDFYLVPEGGYGKPGVEGAAEILNYCSKEKYSHITCAVGTCTMMAGVAISSLPRQEIIGISVLKNNMKLETDLYKMVDDEKQRKRFRIIHDYHFGGYAKYSDELIGFMNEFYTRTLIPSDFVYTAKLFFAITDMIRKDSFAPGSKILMIHSGGLQGNISLPRGMLFF